MRFGVCGFWVDFWSVAWCIFWLVIWSSCAFAVENGQVGWILSALCLVVSSIASFMMFAISHDTIHGSFSNSRLLNHIIGVFATLFLYPAVWCSFRHVHLLHHKYTNCPKKDPDYWGVHQSSLPLLVRCVLQTYSFAYYYYKFCLSSRPWMEVMEFYGMLLGFVAAPFICIYYGVFLSALQCWIIPSNVGLMLVAYFLDILPHGNNTETPQTNPFQTTSAVLFSTSSPSPFWFSFLLQVGFLLILLGIQLLTLLLSVPELSLYSSPSSFH